MSGTHVTTITGHFDPDDFKMNKDGNYIADYQISNEHLEQLTGLKPEGLFSQGEGIQAIEGARSWGLGPHALQFGINKNGKFVPFKSDGHTAAAIGANGNLLVGHTTGDIQGMTQGKTFDLITDDTHLPAEAVEAMGRYKDVSGEHVEQQTFDSHKVVNVQGEHYALVPKTNFVGSIIDRNSSNKDFYNGFYSKGSHVGDKDLLLVKKTHYEEIAKPLTDALYTKAGNFQVRVKSGTRPTDEGVGFTFGMRHNKANQAGGVISEVTHVEPELDTSSSDISETLARLGISKNGEFEHVAADTE